MMSGIKFNQRNLPNTFEQKRLILSDFNFQNVEKVMRLLDLKYTLNDNRQVIPTKEQLVAVADYCIEMALKSEDGFFETGGFQTQVIEGMIELSFVLEKTNLLKNLFSGKKLNTNEIQRKP